MENQSHLERLPKFHAVSLILTFCSISALFIYLVITRNFIFGSIKGNWIYEYFGTTKSYSILDTNNYLTSAGSVKFYRQ